jgi:hypothetical protein
MVPCRRMGDGAACAWAMVPTRITLARTSHTNFFARVLVGMVPRMGGAGMRKDREQAGQPSDGMRMKGVSHSLLHAWLTDIFSPASRIPCVKLLILGKLA